MVVKQATDKTNQAGRAQECQVSPQEDKKKGKAAVKQELGL